MAREKTRYGEYEVDDISIAKGGVGSIHRTDDPRYVYKRYFNPDQAPELMHLQRLVGVGREVLVVQGKKPGQTPESSVNWPVDLQVDARDRVTGVVLPAIPDELLVPEHNKVRTLDFLLLRRARPPSALGRIVLLLRMAEILAFVDSRELVHGDINQKNLAWAATGVPEPIMYLIDCDGMRPQDPPPVKGVAAAGWVDPRVRDRRIPAQDHHSDRYALALAMYRGLLLTSGNLEREPDGSWPGPTQIPAGFPEPLAALLHRALGDPLNHTARPTARNWADALVQVYLPGGRFDTAAIAALDRANEESDRQRREQGFVKVPPMPNNPPRPPRNNGNPPRNNGKRTPPRPPRAQPTPPSRPAPTPQPGKPKTQRQPIAPQPITPRPYRPRIGDLPSGPLAIAAIDAGPKWYVIGAIASLALPWAALLYIAIAFLQLRKADFRYPGVQRARMSLLAFAVVAGGMFLSNLASAAAN